MTGDPVVSVVTGANSGIGRAIAIYLAQQGHTVYGTTRATSRMSSFYDQTARAGVDIRIVQLDVADDESVARGFGEILDEAGQVDVLVNNAGVGGNGVVEELTPEDYLDVMNVNLCGAVRCLRHVLPGMRERRTGAVVNITSLTGRVAAIAQSPYVASKFALEGMSEGLAQELAPFGIRVVIIEPGVTKSAIFSKATGIPHASGAYEAPYRRMLQFYARGIAEASDPIEVAKVVYEAVTTGTPHLRYAMGWGSRGLISGRAAMSDAEWVSLGGLSDDADYYDAFEKYFGVDIRSVSSPRD